MSVPTEPESPAQLLRWQRLIWGITAIVVLYGLVRASLLRWVCDDAFISFRYAENLLVGHGLVWNPGERVEGITNLLWTLLVGVFMAAGANPIPVSEWLGIASYALVLAGVWRLELAWRRPGRLHVPVAVWVLAVLDDLHVWSTGGLETMTAAAFTVGMALLLLRRAPTPRDELLAGTLGGLLFLTRPDGALIAALLGMGGAALHLPERRRALASLVRTGLPVGLTVAATTVFRVLYYGDWLPNTFHAKSANVAWWGQGLFYLGLYFAKNYGLVLLALAATVLLARKGMQALGGAPRWAFWGLLATAGVFSLYVTRSGGDYMFARRLIPIVPLLVLALTLPLQALTPERLRAVLAGGLTVTAAVALPLYPWFGQQGRIGNVANEPWFYPPDVIAQRKAQGEALGKLFQGQDARFLLQGGLCVLAYYSQLPGIIEINGLTDRFIARQPVLARAMAGHEKHPTEDYLDGQRVQFIILQSRPPRRRAFDIIELKETQLYLQARYYDPALMDVLAKQPGVTLLPASQLESLVKPQLARAGCAEARSLFETVDRYLFRMSPTPPPERDTLRALAESRCQAPTPDATP